MRTHKNVRGIVLWTKTGNLCPEAFNTLLYRSVLSSMTLFVFRCYRLLKFCTGFISFPGTKIVLRYILMGKSALLPFKDSLSAPSGGALVTERFVTPILCIFFASHRLVGSQQMWRWNVFSTVICTRPVRWRIYHLM